MVKTRAEAALQAALVERTREYQRIDNARWFRRNGTVRP